MTAASADLKSLIAAANLSDATDRLMLADAIEEARGATLASKLVRAVHLDIVLSDSGHIWPDLGDSGLEVSFPGDEESHYHLNCSWMSEGLGGAWVRGYAGTSDCGEWEEAGHITPYEGSEMTGGTFPDEEYFSQEPFRLDLTQEEAHLLMRRVQKASAASAAAALAKHEAEAALEAVREAHRDASESWTGISWTTDFGAYNLDLDGVSAEDAEKIADAMEAVGAMTDEELEYDADDEDSDESECVRIKLESRGVPRGHAKGLDRSDCEDLAEEWREAVEECLSVQTDAAAAEDAGAAAMKAARSGDWDAALEAAELACEIERRHGDCPTWGPFREAVQTAHDLAE